MKETVAAGATREATVVMDNKVGAMVTRVTEDSKVTRDMVGSNVVRDTADMVNKDTEVTENPADRVMADSKEDGDNTKDMVNSVDMDSKVTEVNKVVRGTVDMVNKGSEVTEDPVVKDMADSKADGANTKDMVNNVDMDNRNTADMDSNMKVNMVQTGTMAEADIMKMKMNPACRDVTRVGRKKIMMKIMMKTMTIMACKAGMERKKMNMMKTKMTTAK
jgi:hypothetical protein